MHAFVTLAAHARARQQQQLERGEWESDRQRPRGSAREPSAAALAPGGPGRRRGRGDDLGTASPLASGLARIAPADEVAQMKQQGRLETAPGGGVDLGLGADGVGVPPRSGGGSGAAAAAAAAGRLEDAAAGAAVSAVVLEPSYARQNPQVVQVRRLRRLRCTEAASLLPCCGGGVGRNVLWRGAQGWAAICACRMLLVWHPRQLPAMRLLPCRCPSRRRCGGRA